MSLSFDEHQRSVWPALVLLRMGREQVSPGPLLDRAHKWFRIHRLCSGRAVAPERLKKPAGMRDIADWVDSVWRILSTATCSQLVTERRSLVARIVNSGLADDEQTVVLTALDYLFRLCSARNVAQTAKGSVRVEIPSFRSPQMQAAYRRILKLAAIDLPIWLTGETGTELEWTARLIHRLRGLPEESLHIFNATCSEPDDPIPLARVVSEPALLRSECTLVVTNVDHASASVQGALYRRLVEELASPSAQRIILTTLPIEYLDLWESRFIPELVAFLAPARVEIPPLRHRREDLEGMISFYGAPFAQGEPLIRFQPETLHLLRSYHWPGNTSELEVVLAIVLRTRPTGPIRPKDLPANVRPDHRQADSLLTQLENVASQQTFRVLRTEGGRVRLAEFLRSRGDGKFGAADLQRLFDIGRETTKRLLKCLESYGLISGIKGAKDQRTTRYRCELCNRIASE